MLALPHPLWTFLAILVLILLLCFPVPYSSICVLLRTPSTEDKRYHRALDTDHPAVHGNNIFHAMKLDPQLIAHSYILQMTMLLVIKVPPGLVDSDPDLRQRQHMRLGINSIVPQVPEQHALEACNLW